MTELLFLGLLVAGPTIAAAILAVFSPGGFGGRQHKWICLGVGLLTLIGAIALPAFVPEPTVRGVMHLREPIELTKGGRTTLAFEIEPITANGYAIDIVPDPGKPRERWAPHMKRGRWSKPRADISIAWELWRGPELLAQGGGPHVVRWDHGYSTEACHIHLGHFKSDVAGPHELRLAIERIPAGLLGERAEVLVDADFLAYKSDHGRLAARRLLRILAMLGSGLAMLVGILMHCCGCPKDDVDFSAAERT